MQHTEQLLEVLVDTETIVSGGRLNKISEI